MYFSDVEKTGETDFVEKPKSIYYMTPPLGKWLVPKSERVAMRLILGGRVTYRYIYIYIKFKIYHQCSNVKECPVQKEQSVAVYAWTLSSDFVPPQFLAEKQGDIAEHLIYTYNADPL